MKIYVRDGIAAVIHNTHTGMHETVFPGRAFQADDPFAKDHPELFDVVEQATAAPGEKRNTSRSS